ncbi:MAG: COPII subunit [Watsoniomyces obsoletus]|nr:MAG: COPII subunit [Watsoniomyces obsoletus]
MSEIRSDSSLTDFRKALGLDRAPLFIWEAFWSVSQTFVKQQLWKKWHEMSIHEGKQVWNDIEQYMLQAEELRHLLTDEGRLREEYYYPMDTLYRKASKQIASRTESSPSSSSSRPFYDPARGSAPPE